MKKEFVPYHKSVLVEEVLTYLDPHPDGVYVDATFGGGGHTRAILEHEPRCSVVAFDWDKNAIDMHQEIFERDFPGRVAFIWGNFSQLAALLFKRLGIGEVDGIIADFGTSQYQISERHGFSVYRDTYLDMRMSYAHQKITAAQVINSCSEKELTEIFWQFGEERYAKKIAQAIVERRRTKKIFRTHELVKLIERVVPQTHKKRTIHPATRVFQALRIYVNKELDNIQAFLNGALRVVKPGGTIVCISFHSLEDRLIKRFFKEHPCGQEKGVEILTKKVVIARSDEIRKNPSARSARLRAARVSAV